MMLGVKEFRERFSEIAEGKEQVFVTKNGRVVGQYQPTRDAAERVRNWAEIETKLARIRDEWKANTPDWEQRMKDYGFGPDGEILDT